MSIEFQVDYIGDQEMAQQLSLSSQLIVPQVSMVVVSASYRKPNKFTVRNYPVVAIRQTIKENYYKDGIDDIDEEPCYHNAHEFEEKGYKFTGRTLETEVLVLNDMGHLVPPYELMGHKHSDKGSHQVIEATYARAGYVGQEKMLIEDVKREARDLFNRIAKHDEEFE